MYYPALLYPQHCFQGHGSANAASRVNQHFLSAGSGCFVPRCWVRHIVYSGAVNASGSISRCSEPDITLLCHLVRTFLKIPKQSSIHSTRNYYWNKVLQIYIHKLETFIFKYGIKISTSKTKTVAFKERYPVRNKIVINHNIKEQIHIFSYLGCAVS